jgi:DNA polymerase III alpha subunit
MNTDTHGQVYYTQSELVDLLYKNPSLDISEIAVTDSESYNASLQSLHLDWPRLTQYKPLNISIEQFDKTNQSNWYMPDQYKNFDIAQWVLDKCVNEAELHRVGEELLLYQERNLFPLLCYLKYLVDTMNQHGIVWGVGRGSSVSSFVLYLIGIHRINSMYYDLDIEEFLKG